MDQEILVVLRGTLDPSKRAESEALLEQAQNHEGFCASLLNIAGTDSELEEVRQVAAIALKNAVKQRWHKTVADRKGRQPLHQSDKAHMMQHLHTCVIRAPSAVQKQLLEPAREIAVYDFPDPWSSLLPACLAALQGSEAYAVLATLRLLRNVAKCLEFSTDKGQRDKLEAFCGALFPVLVPLMAQLTATPSEAPELASTLHAGLKIFWSALYIAVPNALVQDAGLARQWLQTLVVLLRRPVPEAGMPAEAADREKHPWWKLRKWALKLAHRLVARYGDPKTCRVEPSLPFAQLFADECARDMLQVLLEQMTVVGNGAYISRHAFVYLERALVEFARLRATQPLLAPYLHDVLVRVVLPKTHFSAALAAEWRDDPMEVIRKNSTALTAFEDEDMYDVRDAAVFLLREVMKVKALREALLEPFMREVVGIAQAYRAQHDAGPAGIDAETAYRMEGATLCLGALIPGTLVKDKRFRDALEAMARDYLVPLFASPHPFLRAKAAWLAGQYADELEFSAAGGGGRAKGRGPLFDELFELVLQRMNDSDLPVQVEAVNALREFVTALTEAGRLQETISPILKDLLQHFFTVAGAVEAMDVVLTIDKIVEALGEEVAPHAEDCCRELVAMYHKSVAEAPGDEDALFSAILHITTPLCKLVDACHGLPATLARLEAVLAPALHDMCQRKADEAIEPVCEMLSYFTAFLRPFPPHLWHFWPHLHAMVTDWGQDDVGHAVTPLDNFICFGSDTFLSSRDPDYRASLWQMLQAGLRPDLSEFEEAENKHLAKLMASVLLACKGRADDWVWPYVRLSLDRLATAQDPGFGTQLANVLPAALFYDAALTLRALEAHGRTQQAFQVWFKLLQDPEKQFRRAYDKKLTSLALISVLAQPPDSLPATVSQSLPLLLRELLRVLQRFKDQEEAAAAESSDGSDVAEGSSDGADLLSADGSSDIDGEGGDEAYMQLLDKTRATLAARAQGGAGDDDDDFLLGGDWSSDGEDEETALDGFDPFAMLLLTMNGMQDAAPQHFQALVGSLDAQQKEALRDVAQTAQIRSANNAHDAGGS